MGKMMIENPDEILEWNEEKLWNYLQILIEDGTIKNTETFDIKNGFKAKFPIQYVIKHFYMEYPRKKRVSVFGYGSYKITEFWEEIETRKTLMRRLILDNLSDEDPTEARV